MKSALMIVDVQKAMIEASPYNKDEFLKTVKDLLENARKRDMPVIHVQHNGPIGSVLERGTSGWVIHRELSPLPGEYLVQKEFNSSFKNTDLNRILSDTKTDTIILTGMQTEFCIDTTCRVAFEKGYKVIIPEGSNTTFDSELLDSELIVLHHNNYIFNGRFAEVLPPESVIERYYSELFDR